MIEPTDEMRMDELIAAADKAVDTQLNYLHRPQAEVLRVIIGAVLAVVERDRSDAPGLTRGANAARRIADRYGEKGKDRTRNDWQMWTAMSAGARAVAVRLTELADAEDSP